MLDKEIKVLEEIRREVHDTNDRINMLSNELKGINKKEEAVKITALILSESLHFIELTKVLSKVHYLLASSIIPIDTSK